MIPTATTSLLSWDPFREYNFASGGNFMVQFWDLRVRLFLALENLIQFRTCLVLLQILNLFHSTLSHQETVCVCVCAFELPTTSFHRWE